MLNGADAMADAIAVFALTLFAAADGRPAPIPVKAKTSGPAKAGSAARTGVTTKARAGTRPGATATPAGGLAASKGSPS